ncbi:hypothetical protein HDU98_000998 [Podochytrium sp. JEL0797]|nr:hypothetical protein HDU98_000998 [Podochytrium sp. JEL0797]
MTTHSNHTQPTITPAQAVVFGSPMVHFSFLRNSSFSNEFVACVGFALAVSLPLLIVCSDFYLWMIGAFGSSILLGLRYLEIGTIDRAVNSKWTFWLYVEFLSTSDNAVLRKLEQIADEKEALRRKELKLPAQSKWQPESVKPADFNAAFFAHFAFRMVTAFAMFIFPRAYFQKYGYQERWGIISPFDGRGILEQQLFSAMIYGEMAFNAGLFYLFASVVYDFPFFYPFGNVYASTSLREFWSRRWNLVIKKMLHRLSFKPTLKLLHFLDPPKSHHHHHAVPIWHAFIGSMSAFFMSGLLHEYIVFMYIPGQGWGENMAFFLVQGVLCFGQVYLQKATGFGKTWGTGVVGTVFAWACTLAMLFCTAPLFVRPYAQSGTFVNDFTIPVPPVVMEFVRTLI